MSDRTEYPIWKALEQLAQSMRGVRWAESANQQVLSISAPYINLDFSTQNLTDDALNNLIALAESCELRTNIDALFSGKKLNYSENLPALHTALRVADNQTTIVVDDNDVMPDILVAREKMRIISNSLRAGKWLGYSGLPITDVVNIGIGGSDLGPRFCVHALAAYATPHIHTHFISDANPGAFQRVVKRLKPETTLFIIASKSFTTEETLYNARKALAWIGNSRYFDKHFIAVTANQEKARALGVHHILPIWPWIGGRYSLCSAINLITVIAIGFETFLELLAGARAMDEHFKTTPWHQNLPVLLALIGIWNNNFLNRQNLLLLVYAQQLELLVAYVQQLDMESNGKCIDNTGRCINYATAPIVWGGQGNQMQHSYYQLLCQGTHAIAADLISVDAFKSEFIHSICMKKKDALTQTISNGGNLSLNHLRLSHCSPAAIGALSAMYEHKVFSQAVIWNINPFDQPGVDGFKRCF